MLEVLPEVAREGVFGIGIAFEDGSKLWALGWKLEELEVALFPKADEEDPLAVPGNDGLGIDDLVVNRVPQRLCQGVVDDLERAAFVVAPEVLDVLKNEGLGLVILDYVGNSEEEVALLLVFEAMLVAEAELFRDACDAEGLAREPTAEDVVGQDFGERDLVYVTGWCIPKVGSIGALSGLVPVA